MINEAVFFKTKRRGQIAIWVEIPGPDGIPPHNIWDIPEEQLNDDIFNAIIYAFKRGNEFSSIILRGTNTYISVPNEPWETREIKP